jgi:hypothetical protein
MSFGMGQFVDMSPTFVLPWLLMVIRFRPDVSSTIDSCLPISTLGLEESCLSSYLFGTKLYSVTVQ